MINSRLFVLFSVTLCSVALADKTAVQATGIANKPLLRTWNYTDMKEIRIYDGKINKIFFHKNEKVKTPAGQPVLEIFFEDIASGAPAHSIQAKYKWLQGVKKGHSYQVKFFCKATVPGTVNIVPSMNIPPWTTLPGSTKTIPVGTQWQEVNHIFTVDKDYQMNLSLPRLDLGKCVSGSKLYLGPLTVMDLSDKKAQKINRNLIFNSSFKIGISGFNCARHMSPLYNKKMKYIKPEIDTTTSVSGGQSIKIANPYSDEVHLYPREVFLEPGSEYTLSFYAKSDKENTPFNAFFLSSTAMAHSKWTSQSGSFRLGTKWKRYSKTFTTKDNAAFNPYILFLRFNQSVKEAPCTVWLDDIQLDQGPGKNYEPGTEIECASVPGKNIIISEDGRATVPAEFKVVNNSAKKTSDTITVSVKDDYYKKVIFSKKIKLGLKPGGVKNINLEIPVKQFGSYQMDAAIDGKASEKEFRSQPGAFAVIGKYTAKPINLDKTFCVSLNGPSSYVYGNLHRKLINFRGLGCGPEEYAGRLSMMGCRLLRDWTAHPHPFYWSVVEPVSGKFDFTFADMVTDRMARHNIQILPVLQAHFKYTDKTKSWKYPEPEWLIEMRKNSPKCIAKSKKKVDYRKLPPERYAAYVAAVVKHFKGRISHYEMMNEPNLFTPGAEFYMEYLKPAYKALKKADPSARAISFCTTADKGKDVEGFLAQCYALGGLKYADVVSWHPYRARELSSALSADKQIDNIKELNAKYGRPDIPIWNTEVYFIYGTAWSDLPPYRPHHIARRYFTDLGEGVKQSISVEDRTIWKDLLTPSFKFHNFAIPAIEYIPNDNYVFYNAFARFFEGAKPVGKFRWGSSGICYAYERNGEFLAACWDYRNTTRWQAILPAGSAKPVAYDIFGNKIKKFDGRTIKLGVAPIVFRWKSNSITKKEMLESLKNAKITGTEAFNVERAVVVQDSGAELLIGITSMSSESKNGVDVSLSSDVFLKKRYEIKGVDFPPFKLRTLQASVKLVPRTNKKNSIEVKISEEKKVFTQNQALTIHKLVKLNEGKKSPAYNMEKVFGKAPESPEDFSASFSLEKKGNDLYVFINVKDSKRGILSDRVQLWNEDNIQIYLDMLPLSLESFPKYSKHTYKIVISAFRQGKNKISSEYFPGKIDAEVKNIPGGYNMVVRINLDKLNLQKTDSAKLIAFDISAGDSDGKGRESELFWHGNNENYRNRSKFAFLELNK